ncbi:MAG TPA: pseudouridine synthase [Tepidisphaeraceae bacterium]|nr:pseudouridine synthase [Tepidisphaeraceae bacterium]
MKQRIQKILANSGVASRRNIEEMVRQGRVAVNGKVLTELPILVDPERDRVSVDGENLKISSGQGGRRVYILMNKPKGVYSTNVAQGDQVRVIDLLPPEFSERVYPVGRLDAESKGLLLLTNDGELTNRMTHPRYGVPKTYRAVVDGYIGPREIESLQKGVWLSDERSGKGVKATVGQISVVRRGRDRSVLDITLREGRNRQVRRMLARVGHKVRDLTRIKMGPLLLGKLDTGHFRELSTSELRRLHEYLDRGQKKIEAGQK